VARVCIAADWNAPKRGWTLKALVDVFRDASPHWVGDGFPVRTVFSYDRFGAELSPFLLLDYAGPHRFEPATRPRGVGPHPHRGFETVTIVYEGGLDHQDSAGRSGTIGPGDVQWMTAGAGVLHQEFHSSAFTKKGGVFRVMQLWLNLSGARKLVAPRYQEIGAGSIPIAELKNGAGHVRVIAGALGGLVGPAETFSVVNVWDFQLNGGSSFIVNAPQGHTTLAVVVSGKLEFHGHGEVREAEVALFSRDGEGILLDATAPTKVLVLTGAPIDEPIVGRGPFVMNSEAEVRQAFLDFGGGRFGAIDS
jgi:quercetin 2,3-dioxygenase